MRLFVRSPHKCRHTTKPPSPREVARLAVTEGVCATIWFVQISFCPLTPSASHSFGTSLKREAWWCAAVCALTAQTASLLQTRRGGYYPPVWINILSLHWRPRRPATTGFYKGSAREEQAPPLPICKRISFVPQTHIGADLYQGSLV